jgi:hypothetical protein
MYLEHFATCHRIKIYSRGAGTSKILNGVNLYGGGGIIYPYGWNIWAIW